MKTDVAIVIVTYNSAGHIEACLESVMRERLLVNQQVIVVDNQSRDQTVELIRRRFPTVEVLEAGGNRGFAAGVNLGAHAADADFVLLLNPDTVVLEHAVDVIVRFARRNPQYGVYGGKTLKADGSLEPSSCWGVPTLWSMAMFALGLTAMFPRSRRFDPESLGDWQRDSIREVGVVTGCFLLTRKAVWEELGGMDERYFMYGEDVDFAMRARQAGYRPVICPDAHLVHEVGQCSQTPLHKMRLLFRGKASLLRTHWHGPARWLGLACLVLGSGLRAVLAAGRARWRGEAAPGRWQLLWRERGSWLQGYPGGAGKPVRHMKFSFHPPHP